MDDPEYQEWLADFGRRLTKEDLERILARSRERADDDLRGLVKSHLTLRWAVREVLLPLLAKSSESQTDAERSMINLIRGWVSDIDPERDA